MNIDDLPGIPPHLKKLLMEALAKKVAKVATTAIDGALSTVIDAMEGVGDNVISIQMARVLLNRAATCIFSHPMNAGLLGKDTEKDKEIHAKVEKMAKEFEHHGIEFLANHIENDEYDQESRGKVARVMRSYGHTPDPKELEEIVQAARGVWLAKIKEEVK